MPIHNGPTRRGLWIFWVYCALMGLVGCNVSGLGDQGRELEPHRDLWARILESEDRRGAGRDSIAPLLQGLESKNHGIRRIATRALGRLERADVVGSLRPMLSDDVPAVRAEAANALAQAVVQATEELRDSTRALLLARLGTETDPSARGVVAAAVGRVRVGGSGRGGGAGRGRGLASNPASNEARIVAEALAELALDSISEVRLGAALGLASLARQPGGRAAVALLAASALDSLAARPMGIEQGEVDPHARARRTAVATLIAVGAAASDQIALWLVDPDRLLRREASLGVGGVEPSNSRSGLILTALQDRSPEVRYEALRVAMREPSAGCAPALSAIGDGAPQVALLAIDYLATCEPGATTTSVLDSIVRTVNPNGWPAPAHALLGLVGRDMERAQELISAFATHPNPFTRIYSARAAAQMGDVSTLQELLDDPAPNVQAAAIDGLSEVVGHAADGDYLRQLDARTDSGRLRAHRLDPAPQVAMAVSRALAGSPHPDAPAKLFNALERLTGQRSESSRDARIALLDRISSLGGPALAPRTEGYLRDFDPRIADRAAAAIEGWTGMRPEPRPQPLPVSVLPTFEEVAGIEGARVILEMDAGGNVEILLDAFGAPTNAWRFARLAETGALGGLTIHRIVPNFVAQGGSPDANEYAGYARFTRDELGVDGNWRGTVGVSTRGHDTGDGQFYINLVDNLRLDHQYTVFGWVVRGMEGVGLFSEGAVIRRARLVRR